MKDIKNLVHLCHGKNIYIQTHDFPDPDAIASAYGLQKLLKHFEIDAVSCYAGKIDRRSAAKMLTAFQIDIFSYDHMKKHMTKDDAIICVDSQAKNNNVTDFAGKEIGCIDHHPVFHQVDYEYSEIFTAGSCSTMIAKYYEELDIKPDKDTATALLYGMKMDTLQFSRGVTLLDIEMFAYLYPLCDREKLTYLEKNNMELHDLRAYGDAIDHIYLSGQVGFTEISMSCPDGLVAAVSDLILSLEEVSVSIVFCIREDGIKFSVRSEIPEIHAGYLIREALAGLGDGGGHQEMAGGMIKKECQDLLGDEPGILIRERFFSALEKIRSLH